MGEEQILDFLSSTKSPWGFVLSLLLILAMVSGLFSKAAAEYGNIFGAAARAIQRHKQEAIEADKASDARRLDRMEETIQRLDNEVSSLRDKDEMHHEYQLYVASYWRDLQFWAVNHNVDSSMPKMMTYPDWKKATYPDAD